MVAVFGNPVQYSEAWDEVFFVEEGRFLSEEGVDFRPVARRRLNQPGMFPRLQRNQRLMTGAHIILINEASSCIMCGAKGEYRFYNLCWKHVTYEQVNSN